MRHRSGLSLSGLVSGQRKQPAPAFSSVLFSPSGQSPSLSYTSPKVPFRSVQFPPGSRRSKPSTSHAARSLARWVGRPWLPPRSDLRYGRPPPRARCRAPLFSACTLLTSRSLPFRAGGRRSLGSRRLGLSRQGRGAQGAWRNHTRAWPPSFGESRGSVCIVVTAEHYSPGRFSPPPPPIFLMKSSDTPMVSEAKCLPLMVLFRC